MALPFEFVVDGRPASQQASRRSVRRWRESVRGVAERNWVAGDSPVSVFVMLSITYFFTDRQMDVDNIPKPISDALNGVAYFDDEQITDIICRKRYLGEDLRIETSSSILQEYVVRGMPFVHVVVDNAPDQNTIR